jgi:putative colanic acid biosynthesis acetyltransferase WcaF
MHCQDTQQVNTLAECDNSGATSLGIDLSSPDNAALRRGRPLPVEAAWYFIGLPLLESHFLTSARVRRGLLRLFGARVGKAVYIKPGLRVKFPWFLEIGDHCWLGEDLWIDNLAPVAIKSHVCISQGAYLCTGNHDWTSPVMKLFTRGIVCESGCWVGAKALVGPGVVIGRRSVITAGSVVTKPVPPDEIHSGNPARFVRNRELLHHGRKPIDDFVTSSTAP